MDAIIGWLEQTHDRLRDDYDSIVPVIGDEGVGKSTLLLQCGYLWRDVIGREQTVESVVEGQIAWDYDEFKTDLGENPHYSCSVVHDAARVMSRKKAMHAEQIELEEDLFDYHVKKFDRTPILWRFTTERLVSDVESEGFGIADRITLS